MALMQLFINYVFFLFRFSLVFGFNQPWGSRWTHDIYVIDLSMSCTVTWLVTTCKHIVL
jgi:hypothetical protein